ncbi:MAG TPA: hypothetical protein ENK81_03935 [Euryarchaeota archaeon]|nr:hypothetical protein [Euryarchaeota archaeon]
MKLLDTTKEIISEFFYRVISCLVGILARMETEDIISRILDPETPEGFIEPEYAGAERVIEALEKADFVRICAEDIGVGYTTYLVNVSLGKIVEVTVKVKASVWICVSWKPWRPIKSMKRPECLDYYISEEY